MTPLEQSIEHWKLVVKTGKSKSECIPSGIHVNHACYLCEAYLVDTVDGRRCVNCPIADAGEHLNYACENRTVYVNYKRLVEAGVTDEHVLRYAADKVPGLS